MEPEQGAPSQSPPPDRPLTGPFLPDLPPPPFGRRDAPAPYGEGLPTSPVRMHPRSILVRIGAAGIALIYILVSSLASHASSDSSGITFDVVLVCVTAGIGIASWAVTTWSVRGDTVEVSSGIIRRRTVRVPLSRVQAVDLVEPWMARIIGVAEVRLRTGGDRSGDARLAYLKVNDAQAVRTALVARIHGMPLSTPAAPERPLVAVDNRRLVLSTLLLGSTLSAFVLALVEVALFASGEREAAGPLLVYFFAPVLVLGRRIANEWGLAVADSPDGLRLATGLGSRLRETIPLARIQAIHKTEPLFWRMLGWQRLQLHLAGGVSRGRDQPRGAVRRALLPVGLASEADSLLQHVLGRSDVPLVPGPARGRIRAPLSFHFLAAGYDAAVAVSSFGRVCRRTEFVPLAKVQSIRYVQGPLMRMLRLATVRLDAAGRDAIVSFRQRDAAEARELVDRLAVLCANARAGAGAS